MTSQMRPKMTMISAKMASSSNHQLCHMMIKSSALSQRLDQPVGKTISPKLVLMQRSILLSVLSDLVSSDLPQHSSTFCSLVIIIIAHYHFSAPVWVLHWFFSSHKSSPPDFNSFLCLIEFKTQCWLNRWRWLCCWCWLYRWCCFWCWCWWTVGAARCLWGSTTHNARSRESPLSTEPPTSCILNFERRKFCFRLSFLRDTGGT